MEWEPEYAQHERCGPDLAVARACGVAGHEGGGGGRGPQRYEARMLVHRVVAEPQGQLAARGDRATRRVLVCNVQRQALELLDRFGQAEDERAVQEKV